jgi:predicted flap endonuclease-1-like 5' DNA nuclease
MAVLLKIIANRDTVHPITRDRLPKGYLLARISCRDDDDARMIAGRLGWSHFNVTPGDPEEDKKKALGPDKIKRADIDAEALRRRTEASADAAGKAQRDQADAAASRAPQLPADQARAQAFDELQRIKGIGPATAGDLVDHGITSLHRLMEVGLADPGRDQLLDLEHVSSEEELGGWIDQAEALLAEEESTDTAG